MAKKDNIIHFPLNDERYWRETEGSLRTMLTKRGASDDLIDHICHKLKKIFIKNNKTFQVTVVANPDGEDIVRAIQEAVMQVASHYKKITTNLIGEIMTREIDLYYNKSENNH